MFQQQNTEIQNQQASAQASTQPAQGAVTKLDSAQLFRNGQRQIEIIHGESRYSLRLTRENKLILTK